MRVPSLAFRASGSSDVQLWSSCIHIFADEGPKTLRPGSAEYAEPKRAGAERSSETTDRAYPGSGAPVAGLTRLRSHPVERPSQGSGAHDVKGRRRSTSQPLVDPASRTIRITDPMGRRTCRPSRSCHSSHRSLHPHLVSSDLVTSRLRSGLARQPIQHVTARAGLASLGNTRSTLLRCASGSRSSLRRSPA